MRIFVTGHKGFLGRNLLRAIAGHGFEGVTSDARLSPENASQQSLDDVDAVLHLAAQTPQAVKSDAGFDSDILITQQLAKSCLDSNTRFIFASSATVYAESETPLAEDDPLDPSGPYARSKIESEKRINEYFEQGLECFALRLFNAYGPSQSTSYFIPYVLTCALNDKEIELRNPQNVRDYVFIDDVMAAFMKAITCPPVKSSESASFPAFNIGSGVGISGVQLVELIEKILGRTLKVQSPDHPMESNRYVANCTKAKSALGFETKIEFAAGLDRTIADLRSKSEALLP